MHSDWAEDGSPYEQRVAAQCLWLDERSPPACHGHVGDPVSVVVPSVDVWEFLAEYCLTNRPAKPGAARDPQPGADQTAILKLCLNYRADNPCLQAIMKLYCWQVCRSYLNAQELQATLDDVGAMSAWPPEAALAREDYEGLGRNVVDAQQLPDDALCRVGWNWDHLNAEAVLAKVGLFYNRYVGCAIAKSADQRMEPVMGPATREDLPGWLDLQGEATPFTDNEISHKMAARYFTVVSVLGGVPGAYRLAALYFLGFQLNREDGYNWPTNRSFPLKYKRQAVRSLEEALGREAAADETLAEQLNNLYDCWLVEQGAQGNTPKSRREHYVENTGWDVNAGYEYAYYADAAVVRNESLALQEHVERMLNMLSMREHLKARERTALVCVARMAILGMAVGDIARELELADACVTRYIEIMGKLHPELHECRVFWENEHRHVLPKRQAQEDANEENVVGG